MSSSVAAGVLPRLDAFDEEFGPEQAQLVANPGRMFRWTTVAALALAAAAITVLALAGPDLASALRWDLSSPSEKPEAVIARLNQEVEALKSEVIELTQAQQQAADTIARLEAAGTEQRVAFAAWYTDPAALNFGIHYENTAPPRRSATARPRPREPAPPRDDGPVSLEPPQ
jgi:hypothetical protein